MMKIVSDSGLFEARIADETLDGVPVEIWSVGKGFWKAISRETIDAPFHVALDRIHELVNQLRIEPATVGRAYRAPIIR